MSSGWWPVASKCFVYSNADAVRHSLGFFDNEKQVLWKYSMCCIEQSQPIMAS